MGNKVKAEKNAGDKVKAEKAEKLVGDKVKAENIYWIR